jgi:hypothetical protein
MAVGFLSTMFQQPTTTEKRSKPTVTTTSNARDCGDLPHDDVDE